METAIVNIKELSMWIFACEHPFIAWFMLIIVLFILDSILVTIQNCVMFIVKAYILTKNQEVKNDEKDQ